MFENLKKSLYGTHLLKILYRYGDQNTCRGQSPCFRAKKINQFEKSTQSVPAAIGGRPQVKIETILEAILYRMREGCTWRSLSIFAPYTTIYTRWNKWVSQGLWDSILDHVSQSACGKLWAIDGTCIKVHKHAHGASQYADNQCIGKSKGGPNTKAHALVDAKGRALRVHLTAGNRHDLVPAEELVDGYQGRVILADKAYDSDSFREFLELIGLDACIPSKSNRKSPIPYKKSQYKKRHKVENFFQRIKEKRAIATRYEKHDNNFLAMILLCAICDWIKK